MSRFHKLFKADMIRSNNSDGGVGDGNVDQHNEIEKSHSMEYTDFFLCHIDFGMRASLSLLEIL